MPDRKIIDFTDARRAREPEPSRESMLDRLTRMEMIEDLLERLDDLGVQTRDELVDMLDRLESESDGDDGPPPARV